MESLSADFLRAFEVLHGGSPDEVNAVTGFLENVCLHPLALPCLLGLLGVNENPQIRFRSVLTLPLALRRDLWEARPNQEDFVQLMLQLLTKEPEPLIRQNFVVAISHVISPGTYHLVLGYARFALESRQAVELHNAVLLMLELVSLKPREEVQGIALREMIVQFGDALANAAMECGSPDVVLDGLRFAFEWNGNFVEQITEENVRFWQIGLALIEKLRSDDQRRLFYLLRIIGDACEEEYGFADVAAAIPVVFPLLLQEGIDRERFLCFSSLADSLVLSASEDFAASEFLSPLVNRYVQFSLSVYDPDESLSLSNVRFCHNFCDKMAACQPFTMNCICEKACFQFFHITRDFVASQFMTEPSLKPQPRSEFQDQKSRTELFRLSQSLIM
jgi:hypothetical protein